MDLFKRATELLAALAAGVAFVYLLGAGIIWIRLWREGLPTEAVITSLPRELLLSVGLRSIFIPALTFAAFAAAVFFLIAFVLRRGAEAAEQPAEAPAEPPRESTREALTKAAAGIATATIGVGISSIRLLDVPPLWAIGWILGALVVLLAALLAYLWRSPLLSDRTLLAAAVVVGVVATVVRLGVELVDPQFEDVAACVNDPATPYAGVFIGEAERGLHVGDEEQDRVIEIPRDRFTEVWIGTREVTCPEPAG